MEQWPSGEYISCTDCLPENGIERMGTICCVE